MIYLDYLLEATQGQLLTPGKQRQFEAFSHDSRQVLPGEMFVAVRGEHEDGHDYVLQAVERGASGLLVEERFVHTLTEETLTHLHQAQLTIVVVHDTRLALQSYARFILARWRPTVIAVTGSTGKTSTKEAIATVLASNFATFRSWQNYNDLLGLPLSLGRLEERHEYAVLELGCDHPGEIEQLCQLIQPHIGVLTNISPAQLQYFGTIEQLAAEFGKLLRSLPEDGLALVNGNDERIASLLKECQAALLPFYPEQLECTRLTWQGTDFQWPTDSGKTISLSTRLIGKHFATPVLAACMAGRQCGISDEDIQYALARMQPLPGRINPMAGAYGSHILDDTHNATPAAMSAGLETLQTLPAGHRIAILGDMLRLGSYEEEAVSLVGKRVAECADYLIARGKQAVHLAEAAQEAGLTRERILITSTHQDAAQVACHLIEGFVQEGHTPEVAILVKGSEETRMERVVEQLLAEPTEARDMLVRQTPGWKQIVVMRAERPTWLEIDLSAIAQNTRQIQEIIGPQVRILASLKADAYGHGALKVARTVLLNGASMIGVATVSEAVPLREAGIQAPILVFGYVPLWQMREAIRLDLTITLYSLETAQALARTAESLRKKVKVHIKVDTGMGRLGIRAEQVEEILSLAKEIKGQSYLELEGIFTHFATADDSDQTYARKQLSRFQSVLAALQNAGIRPPIIHAANSAAMLSLPDARFDMVRPGVALYGLHPSTDVPLPANFRPALTFKTQVAQVKLVPAGEGISYGCTYVTERPTVVATLPVGYADGFRRAPSNWGTVLIHGQEAPLLGRVCMDQCMIDVTHIEHVRTGDEVVLIGRQGNATLSAERVAQRLGTSNYEVVSAILARVPRVD